MTQETRLKRTPDDSKSHRVMLWLFGFVVFAGGSAFFYKLYEFFVDLTDSDGLRFAGMHLLTYCMVAGGFLLLLAFCFLTGQFADIEEPKFKLMETEMEYDHQEFRGN